MTPATQRMDSPDHRNQVVNRLGVLREQLSEAQTALKPHREEAAKLEAKLLSWYEDLGADQPAVAESTEFLAEISKRDNARKITDRFKCFKLLKMTIAEFLKVCTIPLKLVDDRIPLEKHKLFLVEERTGSRSVKLVRRTGQFTPAA